MWLSLGKQTNKKRKNYGFGGKLWQKNRPQGGSTGILSSFSSWVVLSSCTLLFSRPLSICGEGIFLQPACADCTRPSRFPSHWDTSKYFNYFFFKFREGVCSNCHFSSIPTQLPDFWYLGVVPGGGDSPADVQLEGDAVTPACGLVLRSFATAGIQE